MTPRGRIADVPLKFEVSARVLYAPTLRVQVREAGLGERPVDRVVSPEGKPPRGVDGYLIRSQPVGRLQPRLRRENGWLRYVPFQYPRYYVDLNQSFEQYCAKFSSKSRSTLRRKVRRFEQATRERTRWRVYATAEELTEFHALARQVSEKTYQERLLGAGLPDTQAFKTRLTELAGSGRALGFILFFDARPISYLYCPVRDGTVLYQYLGYDPEFSGYSPGTVLQWYALQHLFAAGRYRLFDFSEGYGDHKRLFATGSQRCANIFFLRATPKILGLVLAHRGFEAVVSRGAAWLDELGVGHRVRTLVRSGGGAA